MTTIPEPTGTKHISFNIPRAEEAILDPAGEVAPYKGFETVFRFREEQARSEPNELQAGAMWHFATVVFIQPHLSRFLIRVYAGATEEDVALAEDVIAAVKAGRMSDIPFDECVQSKDGERYYSLYLGRGCLPPESRLGWDMELMIVPCTAPGCTAYSKYHTLPRWAYRNYGTGENVSHEHERFEGEGYLIRVFCDEDDRRDPLVSEPWKVAVEADDCYMPMSAAAGMVSDLQWALASVQKLNGVAKAVPCGR